MRPGEENTGTFVDLLRGDEEAVDDRLARDELLKKVAKRIPEFTKTLNDKEKKLLSDRILAEEPKTLQEVADLYGLTRERARQIEAKVIQKLKDFLTPDLR
jgi:RNA polymerase sigma-32 factor